MAIVRPDQSSGGGGGGGVQDVTAGDTSIVVGGTAAHPTVVTADLATIAADHATAADVAMNAHKITGLANGSAATDAAAFGQIPATDGWVDDTAETWTETSATTFTVPGDKTTKYSKGTRIKLTQTTVKYFVVIASSYDGTTNTTVTVTGGSDYALAAAAISANYHSYMVNPQGYPGWFNFAPAATGFSGTPTVNEARFSVMGQKCSVIVNISGTSNATTFGLTLPITNQTTAAIAPAVVTNGGADSTAYGCVFCVAGSAAASFFRDPQASVGWTSSGTKKARTADAFDYEI